MFAEPPFRAELSPHLYHPAESAEEALSGILVAILGRRRLAVLTGPPGAGKTMLLQRLMERLREEGVMVVSTPTVPDATLDQMLQAAAQDAVGQVGDLEEAVEKLEAALEAAGSGVLVLDDAHVLADDVLRDLVDLTDEQTDTGRFLQVVLAGEPSLGERLGRITGGQVGRIGAVCRLQPMTPAQVAGLIRHRLRAADASDTLFDEEAVRRIAELGGGNTARVIALAGASLELAQRLGADQVDAAVVDAAAGTSRATPAGTEQAPQPRPLRPDPPPPQKTPRTADDLVRPRPPQGPRLDPLPRTPDTPPPPAGSTAADLRPGFRSEPSKAPQLGPVLELTSRVPHDAPGRPRSATAPSGALAAPTSSWRGVAGTVAGLLVITAAGAGTAWLFREEIENWAFPDTRLVAVAPLQGPAMPEQGPPAATPGNREGPRPESASPPGTGMAPAGDTPPPAFAQAPTRPLPFPPPPASLSGSTDAAGPPTDRAPASASAAAGKSETPPAPQAAAPASPARAPAAGAPLQAAPPALPAAPQTPAAQPATLEAAPPPVVQAAPAQPVSPPQPTPPQVSSRADEPDAPRPDPSADRIRALAAKADRQLEQQLLTVPAGNNALETAREIETLAPRHPEANRVRTAIVDAYIQLARTAEERQQVEEARRYYTRALGVQPENATVQRMAQELDTRARSAEQQAAASRTPAQEPDPRPTAQPPGFTGPEALVRALSDPDTLEAVVAAGTDFSRPLPDGRTPLMVAAAEGRVAAIRLLIDRGRVNIDQRDPSGWTALMYAAAGGHADAVNALIQRGADRTLRNNRGQTAVDLGLAATRQAGGTPQPARPGAPLQLR
ncbi:MAG TPA: AAA family ATPase [Azospirillaceae bacterium]|nr:AAA family ATPase [Azospirillaceae bacterium]